MLPKYEHVNSISAQNLSILANMVNYGFPALQTITQLSHLRNTLCSFYSFFPFWIEVCQVVSSQLVSHLPYVWIRHIHQGLVCIHCGDQPIYFATLTIVQLPADSPCIEAVAIRQTSLVKRVGGHLQMGLLIIAYNTCL